MSFIFVHSDGMCVRLAVDTIHHYHAAPADLGGSLIIFKPGLGANGRPQQFVDEVPEDIDLQLGVTLPRPCASLPRPKERSSNVKKPAAKMAGKPGRDVGDRQDQTVSRKRPRASP